MAQTGACVERPPIPYGTQVTLTVAGHQLVRRSQYVYINCNKPADDRCQLIADAPRVINDDLVAPAKFNCVSDRRDLIWRVELQDYNHGAWESDGFRTIERQSTFKGGKTYPEVVHQPCANEVGPWPERLRTFIELRRSYGGTITRTSQAASLTCPNKTATLQVDLTSSSGGRVTSSPAGIDCPGPSGPPICSHDFPVGTQVTLTATPASGFRFAGWSGDCSDITSTCTLTMDGPDRTAIADFKQQSGPPGTYGK
jgi:hypothetical protein